MKITTNNHWRQFSYRSDVPADVLASQFDYLEEGDGGYGFFKYRGFWYHVSDFMRNNDQTNNWHGHCGESYFSGVLIELSKDCETFKVARYSC